MLKLVYFIGGFMTHIRIDEHIDEIRVKISPVDSKSHTTTQHTLSSLVQTRLLVGWSCVANKPSLLRQTRVHRGPLQ